MIPHDNEVLDPMTWLERIKRLFDGIGECEADPERHIRTAYHLVRLAPGMVSRALPAPIEEDLFEAMLADANYRSAVVTLLGPSIVATRGESIASTNENSLAMLADWAGSFLPLKTQLN